MAFEDLVMDPNILGGSFIVILFIYVIAFALQMFMMYLNWKQSKVNNQMTELLEEVREIKKLLKKGSR